MCTLNNILPFQVENRLEKLRQTINLCAQEIKDFQKSHHINLRKDIKMDFDEDDLNASLPGPSTGGSGANKYQSENLESSEMNFLCLIFKKKKMFYLFLICIYFHRINMKYIELSISNS